MSLKLHILLIFSNFFCVYGLSKTPAIIVIGAGSSGIAATTKLWKNNFTDIRILEAESRIGGRIHSIKFGDAYVDLGGEWCQGERGNVVYDIVKPYSLLKNTNLNIQLYYSNGTLLTQDVFKNLVDFSGYFHPLEHSETEQPCKNFSSAGECFENLYNATFFELYQNNSDLHTISMEAREWLKSYLLSFDSSFSLFDSSLKSAYKIIDGNTTLNWDGKGYKTFLEVMLQQYPDPTQELALVNNILLKKEVTKIVWADNNKVHVFCLDNTTYTADHVIFTPSLGVLKANHESLFHPALPVDKVRAIKGMGFGAIMKIVLHFPYTWWNVTQTFAFIWSSEDKKRILTEFGRGPVKNGRSWLTTHEGFITAERNPKVLVGFFTGEMIPEMEQASDDVLTAGCMYMFRKFLSGTYSNITEPYDMIKTTWYSNSHFKGTYSYDSAKSTEELLHDKLGAPLRKKDGYPTVLFAGEATHPYCFGSVHGAVESGYNAARNLVDFYSDNRT